MFWETKKWEICQFSRDKFQFLLSFFGFVLTLKTWLTPITKCQKKMSQNHQPFDSFNPLTASTASILQQLQQLQPFNSFNPLTAMSQHYVHYSSVIIPPTYWDQTNTILGHRKGLQIWFWPKACVFMWVCVRVCVS